MTKGKPVSFTHTTSDTKYVGFFLIFSSSDLELEQTPKIKGSAPQDCPSLDNDHK